MMKQGKTKRTILAVGVSALLCLASVPGLARGQQGSQASANAGHSAELVSAFEARVKAYVKLREGIEEKMPKLSKDSTPEQIEAHKAALQEKVRAARAGAKHGDIFLPAVTDHIRAIIKAEVKGQERQELRQTVLEADTKGVPLRVNYPYPETKELVEMPPTLLLKLPQLPKQVKYRYVGRHMLLVDRENGLILDYMLNALP